MSVVGVGVEVAQVVEIVLAAVAVQVAEAVEVFRVAEVVLAVEVDLQVARVAAVDPQAPVAVEAVLVVAVLEEVQVGLVAVLEVDLPVATTTKFVARKQGTLLKAPKRAKMLKRSLQKATEADGAYHFTCQAD